MAQLPSPATHGGGAARRARLVLAAVAAAPLVGWAMAASAATTDAAAGPRAFSYSLMFSLLFLMLGPIKILAPFVAITEGAEPALKRRLATRSILIAAAAIAVAALLGRRILDNFGVPLPVLGLAGGIILFLVALQQVLQQYTPRPPAAASAPSMQLAFSPLAFPTIVTPYGIAAVILFVSLAPDTMTGASIYGVVVAVLAINWVAMLFAEAVLRWLGPTLQIFGVVLGMVQVALGLDVILRHLHALNIISLNGV